MIHGICAPEFREVQDVFAASFEGPADDMNCELGASIAVCLNGEPVIDLWGGFKDETRTGLWERDTIVCVQSVSKGVLAACALLLVDRGLLELGQPIAHYWPEFGQKGKSDIPVLWALTHQAGLPAWEVAKPGLGYEWERAVSGLAASKPDLRPGVDNAYHPYTFGFIVGELVQRVSKQPLPDFLKANVTDPLGMDFTFGVSAGEYGRVATFTKLRHGDNVAGSSASVPPKYADIMRRAIDVLDHDEDYNSVRWRSAVIPAANGHTNARALARYYSMLAQDGLFGGRQLLSKAVIDQASQVQWSGADLVIPAQVSHAIGFMKNCPAYPAGPNPDSFGHAGFGGAYGFADRRSRLSFGYTPNKMWLGATLETGKRCTNLVDAVYRCVSA